MIDLPFPDIRTTDAALIRKEANDYLIRLRDELTFILEDQERRIEKLEKEVTTDGN